MLAVLSLQAFEFGGDMADRDLPAHRLPRIADALAQHRRGDAVAVRRIAEREAAFDAGMAVVRLAVLVGDHAHEFLALHLGAEGTTHAAIGAGRDDAVLGLAERDQRFLGQRRSRASLYAGAAADAFGTQERFVLAGRDGRIEAAALDGQRERALHFVAGAHAARTHDALGWIEGEIGIALVFLRVEVIRAVVAVAHFAQADRAGHVLQLAVAVGRAGEAVERMVGNIQFHDAATQLAEFAALRPHLHARGDRCGA
jgi:hypothetical protein